MKYQGKIVIPQKESVEIDRILSACAGPVGMENYARCETCDLEQFVTISYEVQFLDGSKAELRVCPGCPPWTEAIMISCEGDEIVFSSEPSENLFGCWELENGDDHYIVEITREAVKYGR